MGNIAAGPGEKKSGYNAGGAEGSTIGRDGSTVVVKGGAVTGPTTSQSDERPEGEKSLVIEPTAGKVPPAVGVVEAIVVVVGVEKMALDEVTGLEEAVGVGEEAVVLGTTDTEAELTGIMLVSTLDKLAASMRAARAT